VNHWGSIPLFQHLFPQKGIFPDFAYVDHITIRKTSQGMGFFSEEATKTPQFLLAFCGFFIAKRWLYAILRTEKYKQKGFSR
jgi:hypothetical protein